MPCTTPGTPRPIAAPPAASTPTSDGVGVDEAGEGARRVRPAADAGHHPVGVGPAEQLPALLAGLVAHHPLELAHHPRVRVRPHHRPEAVVGVATVATQSRRASLTASFRVRLPARTGRTSAPSSSMRNTLSSWRSVSTSPM